VTVLNILAIIALYASFFVLHSFLATLRIKTKIARRYPAFMPYYRFTYTIIALVHFYIVYELTPYINIKLYDLPNPFDIIVLIPQFGSLVGILWCFAAVDAAEFLGIAQVFRARRKSYKVETLDEQSALTIGGPYRLCRHPLYFFIICALWFRPYMFLDYFVASVCITVYLVVGAKFEESRMIEQFGGQYRDYQRTTQMIIPIKFFRRV
jgi:protein-S-isoprenylcysteine O-methyltransferase Ste14